MPNMNKTQTVSAIRGLRTAYAASNVTCTAMVADLGRIPGLPPAAKQVAESAYKNAETVGKSPDGHQLLSGNKLVRIALNTAIGSAKRGVFGF